MSGHEHDGHRQRLLKKVQMEEPLEWHEYLEALLYYCIPRVNTNETAHRLLSTFGSVEGVFSADAESLKRVKGIGDNSAAFLRMMSKFIKYYLNNRMERTYPKKFDAAEFLRILPSMYASETKEVFDCYLLDESSNIILRKRFTSDRATTVFINPQEISAILANCHPHGVVFVHNHIDFNCMPSRQDDRTTAQLQLMCSMQNVRMLDHFICSSTGAYSYYDNNRMQEISRRFSVGALLDQAEQNLTLDELLADDSLE